MAAGGVFDKSRRGRRPWCGPAIGLPLPSDGCLERIGLHQLGRCTAARGSVTHTRHREKGLRGGSQLSRRCEGAAAFASSLPLPGKVCIIVYNALAC